MTAESCEMEFGHDTEEDDIAHKNNNQVLHSMPSQRS